MRKLTIVFCLLATLGLSCPVLALSLVRGIPTPLTSPEGTLECRSCPDEVGLSGALVAPDTLNPSLNIPVFRIQYDLHNTVTPPASITTFTIHYDPLVGPHLVAASMPVDYTLADGSIMRTGGLHYSVLLNAGYGTYNYDTSSAWTIDYQVDHITFSVKPGAQALPSNAAIGATGIGSTQPFSINFDRGIYMDLVTGKALPSGTGSDLKGEVVGPTTIQPQMVDIATAKTLPDGRGVTIKNKSVAGRFGSSGSLYVEEAERNAGILVDWHHESPDEGHYAYVIGIVNSDAVEKTVMATSVTDSGPGTEIRPLLMNCGTLGGAAFGLQRALPSGATGLNNVGLLVRTTGKVVSASEWAFSINDGSTSDPSGLSVQLSDPYTPIPPIGSCVAITGESAGSLSPTGQPIPAIRPRRQSDIRFVCAPLLFVYSGDRDSAEEFKALLDASNLPTDIVYVVDAETMDLSPYSMILIGADTGFYGDLWGTFAAFNNIVAAGKPILGIGSGGAVFFQKMGLPIGWGNAWINSSTSIYAVNTSSLIYFKPQRISMPTDRILALYDSAVDELGVYFPTVPSNIEVIGREVGDTSHYPIVRQDGRYMLWGFSGPPSKMLGTGKSLFVNTVLHNTR